MVASMVFGLVAGLAGAIFVLVGLSYFAAYVRMLRADRTDVAAVNEGMGDVELSGTARPIGEPFASHFEDADVLVNDWEMAKLRRGGGKSQGGWVALESGYDVEPYLLDDGTGEIVVDPRGAEWVLDTDCSYTTDEETPPPTPEIREFLAEVDRLPMANDEWTGRAQGRRYKEDRLDAGDEVYVHGPVKSGPADDAPDRAVRPYVGTDSAGDVDVRDRTTMQLSPELLPFVGSSEGTLSVGGADESAVFAISDSPETAAQRRYLKRGSIVSAFGLCFLVFGAIFLGIIGI